MNRIALRQLQAPLTRALGPSPTRFWTVQSGQALVAVRCYASDKKEPSWSDMAKAGASLISQGVSQIGSAVCKGLAAILPSRRQPTSSNRGPLPDGKQPGRVGTRSGWGRNHKHHSVRACFFSDRELFFVAGLCVVVGGVGGGEAEEGLGATGALG